MLRLKNAAIIRIAKISNIRLELVTKEVLYGMQKQKPCYSQTNEPAKPA